MGEGLKNSSCSSSSFQVLPLIEGPHCYGTESASLFSLSFIYVYSYYSHMQRSCYKCCCTAVHEQSLKAQWVETHQTLNIMTIEFKWTFVPVTIRESCNSLSVVCTLAFIFQDVSFDGYPLVCKVAIMLKPLYFKGFSFTASMVLESLNL